MEEWGPPRESGYSLSMTRVLDEKPNNSASSGCTVLRPLSSHHESAVRLHSGSTGSS